MEEALGHDTEQQRSRTPELAVLEEAKFMWSERNQSGDYLGVRVGAPISEGGQERAFRNGPHLLDLGEGFTEPASLQAFVRLFIVGTLRPQKKKKN